MNPLDRVGPTLPANPLRRVEDRRKDRERGKQPPPKPPAAPGRHPGRDDGERPHRIDELA